MLNQNNSRDAKAERSDLFTFDIKLHINMFFCMTLTQQMKPKNKYKSTEEGLEDNKSLFI